MIHARNIEHTWRDASAEVRCLRGLDLELEAGEFCCLRGVSGSGTPAASFTPEPCPSHDQVLQRLLAHAVDDRPVPPENSRALYKALQAIKIPSEYLELPNGGHGLNGYKGPSWDAWQKGSLEWLAKIKMIPAPTKR